jgi:hypothetical protein
MRERDERERGTREGRMGNERTRQEDAKKRRRLKVGSAVGGWCTELTIGWLCSNQTR